MGYFSLKDVETSRRSQIVITDLRKMPDKDRQVTYRQIQETLSSNAPAIRSILKYHLVSGKSEII